MSCSHEACCGDSQLPCDKQQYAWCSVMVSTKGDTRAHRLPKDTCRFGTDLKFADLQSVKSTKWINDCVASSSEHLVVNTDRYIFQMSALASMLSKGAQVCCTPTPCLSVLCMHCSTATTMLLLTVHMRHSYVLLRGCCFRDSMQSPAFNST